MISCSFGSLTPPRLSPLIVGTSTASAGENPFLGEIEIVAFNFAPQGWAMCNGQILPISQNTALFSLLGTQYGGNGTTTFALPNLQGRFPMHYGQGAGLTPRSIGEVGGQESYVLTVAQLPAHSHPLMGSDSEASVVSPDGAALAAKARVPLYTNSAPNAVFNINSIGSTGEGQPHPVMPPYLALNYIIATQGVYPSRP